LPEPLIPTFSRKEKEPPLSLGEDEGEGNPTLVFEPAAKGGTVLSTVILLRTFMKRQSATAPEKIRTKVNVAASM
jgi:hypothetical protein